MRVTDWSGEDYAKISALQRAMIEEAKANLALGESDRVLDVGCGDGHLTRAMARMVSRGYAVGVDPSRRMIATAHSAQTATASGPWFVLGDARRLPFTNTSTLWCRSTHFTGCPNSGRHSVRSRPFCGRVDGR